MEPDYGSGGSRTPLTPADFGIGTKGNYHLNEIAKKLAEPRPGDDPVEARRRFVAALRALERECERGALRGVRLGRNIWVPAGELARYFLANNTLVSLS